ncbi:STY0301 family protein [Bowmanella pacifica]|uniref:Lipoprotein n=1 Tax=Bowmanella pacifica TaxID=502051 RepID=A0A918DID0_9ALTE|nr:STY0301 family protein [Bowmanella pacifica]GGO67765.1 hypothetical protein GCM10010982_15070 [Bowmanella pacifica]
MNKGNWIITLSLMALAGQACATQEQNAFECPQAIQAGWQVSDVPSGWQMWGQYARTEHTHNLVSLTFSDGPVEEGALLRPQSVEIQQDQAAKVVEESYDFSDKVNNQIWQVCLYADSPVMLSRPLPQQYSVCAVRSIPQDGSIKAYCK